VTESETAARDLAERHWEGLLVLDPTMGTWIGDERYDDRLPDPTEAGLAARRDFHQGALEELKRIDRADLDVELRTTLEILESASRRELGDIEHRMDRFHAATHLFGPSNLLAQLSSVQRANSPERVEKYAARLAAFRQYLGGTEEVVAGAARAGQTVPSLVADRTIGQVERLLALAPEDSPGMKPVPEDNPEWRDRIASVLRQDVWPAYQGYLDALRAYRPSARDTIGLRDLPDGDAVYASQILGFTTLALEPRKIHDLGREQLAGIQEERRHIAERLGFADVESAIAERNASGTNTAGSREELLRLVEDQVRRSWEAAPRFFGRLPNANCEVRPVERFQEDDMPGAFYNSPTADGSRPGVYYLNTGHLEARLLHQTATTSFHEANPGHHFQLSIEIEFSDRLPLRRFGGFLVGDSFVEGWGLYSERLADEMGLFLDDYERLGMLEAQAFRAGRLIVDTGIHALGWDRERAVRQMQETGAPRPDAEIEVDRYIAWPGQALAYMVGKLEIDRWRKEAAEREGKGFSLQAFHDRVLALGSLPLATLDRELRDSRG